MSPYLNGTHDLAYFPLEQTRSHFRALKGSGTLSGGLNSPDFQEHATSVTFTAQSDEILFPCPFRQTELISVLKRIEGCWAACIADLRYGKQDRNIEIHLDRSARYLLGSYLFKIDGLAKGDLAFRNRRSSTNVYATKRSGEYFQLHGSLDASTPLKMVGMEAYRPDLTKYYDIVSAIEGAVKNFTVEELEEINAKHTQAGTTVNKREAFLKTAYVSGRDIQYDRAEFSIGKRNQQQAAVSVEVIEIETPPAAFSATKDSKVILSRIEVVEMCRIIVGPSICRILTEYGADVIKVTSPNLSDTPFFQVEGNMGKHATDLDLRSEEGRKVFEELFADANVIEELLADADVIVDGYRTGALSRLGYGPQQTLELAVKRGKGMIYVSENFFGYGTHVDRPGWQQVADAVSRVAWAQGKFIGIDEPCIPPFLMSDYGTGLIGTIATLKALFSRAKRRGSYHAKCCLVQYDNLLFQFRQYPDSVQDEMRKKFAGPFLDLKHADNTDMFSKAALAKMNEVVPTLFEHEGEWGQTWTSKGYNGMPVRCIRPASNVEGVEMGYRGATRPNGTNAPIWEDWEEEQPWQ